MVDWTSAFQGTPAGTDQLADGDDRIRELKETIRDELKVEHDAGTASVDASYVDTGRHKTGSARTFCDLGSVAAPSTLMKHSNAGNWPPILAETDKVPASNLLDNGRLWVDWDDCQPFVREQEITGPAWTDINTNHGDGAGGAPGVVAANWLSLWPRSVGYMDTATTANQTAGFVDTREAIDGGLGGDLAVAVATPNDGRSYEIVVQAKIQYSIAQDEQLGFWLVEDVGPTDVDEALIYFASGGTGHVGGIVLSYIQTAPVAGTTYTYTVEFAANAIANCYINPNTANVHWAGGGAAAGHFIGTTSMSRITAELRPRYLVASYSQV